jgi:hypothetical protein
MKISKKQNMKQYLLIFLVVGVLVGLVVVGVKYKDKLSKLKNFFNFECVDISKLETENEKHKKDIVLLSKERELLKPLMDKQKNFSDSLRKVDSLLKLEILKEREYTKILERRLSSSKDSVRKYRSVYTQSVKKYEQMKKNQKKPTNEQTLEFFKKY